MENLILNSSQMLQTWRKCAGLEPSDNSCTIERFDGIDIDALISMKMRQWYLRLLHGQIPDIAPPVSDITSLLEIYYRNGDCYATLLLDDSICSVKSLRLSHWLIEAQVRKEAEVCSRLSIMKNPFAVPGDCHPLAWIEDDSLIRISPVSAKSTIVKATGVVDPGPDLYILPPTALSAIPRESLV